jgi:hypothetical protein
LSKEVIASSNAIIYGLAKELYDRGGLEKEERDSLYRMTEKGRRVPRLAGDIGPLPATMDRL